VRRAARSLIKLNMTDEKNPSKVEDVQLLPRTSILTRRSPKPQDELGLASYSCTSTCRARPAIAAIVRRNGLPGRIYRVVI